MELNKTVKGLASSSRGSTAGVVLVFEEFHESIFGEHTVKDSYPKDPYSQQSLVR